MSDIRQLALTAQLTVVGYTDGHTEHHGYGPTDLYAEICWLPIIGPSTLLLWKALNRRIPLQGVEPVEVDTTDLMVGLGLGHGPGRSGAGARAVTRLVMFGFAFRGGQDGSYLAVRRAIGPVPEHRLVRLPNTARGFHDRVIGR